MTYAELDKLLQGRCRMSRKLAGNTYAERRENGELAIKFHATYILTFFPDGGVRVCNGGWQTVTTIQRINKFLAKGFTVFSRRGTWYLYMAHRPFYEEYKVNGRIQWRKMPVLDWRHGVMISAQDRVLATLAEESRQ